MKIHFFHTNDVHSHFEEYLQSATQLRRHRDEVTQRGETVFTFDIGDHADRKRMETEGTLGRANAALLRTVGYDAWVFGNNEGLILPKSSWADLVRESATPVLTSNLFDDESREGYPFFEPYLILERGGLRVGVFGVTVAFSDFYNIHGVFSEHPRDTFHRLLPEIQAQGVDLVVLLSHLGLHADRQIAQEIEGIDLILGGHTHQVTPEPELVGQTWICQAGCYGGFYGHVELEWDVAEQRVRGVSGGAIPRDPSVVPDADLESLLAHWQELAAEELSAVIVELPDELGHHLIGNSALGHLLADGMRRLTGADIAMINGGMFNHGLIAGPCTRQDLLTCFPSPSLSCVVELSGAQIRDVLQKSLLPGYYERVGKGYGFRGHYLGGLQVSGLRIRVVELGEFLYDLQIEHAGEPLDLAGVYRVAAPDYLYFSAVYEEFKEGRSVSFHMPFLRELLGQELQGAVAADVAEPRWIFEEVAS
ncbi:bifunctional metallophosphatase/5'-nucleotidase [Tumebacillus permanentifrigoris]|uniref:2',3'-cyclic-nucleotide 2'-phosphodiesterase (5'-nucleotidase family) n=1 Tax=Tumebacillus permanentifrigoris TaxID=378543 RepID=A0A316DC48_9BACL|nr:bifunctional UDP-sugar hydrolase/5'-nucleotidase [Tumebacillus permanentifrigoris]PWK13803.1 2',3'-cyclic-nucleotide 2'-phosphodiesterase (5'-nucleotidase family) [Tumebacillus permanentifrigoris]